MVWNSALWWKKATSITNSVETTRMSRYARQIEITYGQGSEYVGHEFSKSVIEEKYRITSEPSTSENLMSNAVLEQIHQVLENILWTFNIYQTYVTKN